MSDAAAPKEDEGEEPSHSGGTVMVFRRPASVEYDGEAQRSIAQLSQLALKASALSRRAGSQEAKAEAIALLERIAERMDLLDEHIGVLELHADMIIECMSEEENAYFINESKKNALTVTSLIKKRCKTIRLQKYVVGSNSQSASVTQDNEEQHLIDCDGALACSLDRRPAKRAG